MEKIKWEHGKMPKYYHAEDGCFKIIWRSEPRAWELTVGFSRISIFKKLSSAKQVAQLIKNG